MDVMIVSLAIAAATAYAGWKLWGMVKPGAKAGCHCGDAKSSCGSCPIAKP